MVDAMEYDYREPNEVDKLQFPLINELLKTNFRPKIIELNIAQEAPDTSFTEIMVDYTAIFDGTSTPAVVYYDSTDVKEAAAGVGVRTIKILGTNEAGDDFQEITDTMDGTTGTATAEKFQRLIAVKSATAGSEGDAAGTITIQDDAAGSNVHMTIAQANNCSISARIYLPDDFKGIMHYIRAEVTEVAHATAAITANTGFIFAPIVEENSGVVSDEVIHYTVSSSRPVVEIWNPTKIIESGDGANYLSLKHVAKEADNNSLALYKIIYVVWGTTNSQRGIPA